MEWYAFFTIKANLNFCLCHFCHLTLSGCISMSGCTNTATRHPSIQRHLAVKLLLIFNIEKMTENVLPSICQKIINLQQLLHM
jgi:hypothetical protein